MKTTTKENLAISTAIFISFLLFLITWHQDGGAWLWGLYSEVDGQLAAWDSKYLLLWSHPFDMSVLNPFQGMGSLFMPMNPWWNPGALALGLSQSNSFNILASYSIYWVEIFFATYYLAKISGLNKVESILAAELLVFIFFPPFAAYFKSIPYFSLAPANAHWMSLMIIITISSIKLGGGDYLQNCFWALLLTVSSFMLMMSAGAYFIPFLPVYILYIASFMFKEHSQKQLLWKITIFFLIVGCLWLLKANRYYKDTFDYISAAVEPPKDFAFAVPVSLENKYFFISSLLGSVVALFSQKKKHRNIALSFLIIFFMPETIIFLLEQQIITGEKISKINSLYYLWAALPLFCIFSVILTSFTWRLLASKSRVFIRSLVKLRHCEECFLRRSNPENSPGSPRLSASQPRDDDFALPSSKILLSLTLIPMLATFIWFHAIAKNRVHLKYPEETPIVAYLKNQIGLNPGDTFKGTTISYFASKNSPLRPFMHSNFSNTHSPNDYIATREFLYSRYKNRHMFSDLWNYNIPTLEEYGHLISLPTFIFFQNVLAKRTDIFDRHFLNVYNLNLKALRALGARYIISDALLDDKNLTLVLTQNPPAATSGPNHYPNYKVVDHAIKLFDQLKNTHSKPILGSSFRKEYLDILNTTHPLQHDAMNKITGYFNTAVICAVGEKNKDSIWTISNLEKIKFFFLGFLISEIPTPPLYLYEIKHANLANYSPTHLIQMTTTADAIFQQISKPDFLFDNSVVVQESISASIAKNLVKAKNTELRFERNNVQISAESNGWSLLLLPLQYSHCLIMNENKKESLSSQPRPKLVRANLIQSALLFNKKLDVRLDFKYGIGKNVACRQKDIQDMQSLSLIAAKSENYD